MKRLLAAAFSMLVGVVATLAAVLVLLRATLYIEKMSSPLLEALAILATLFLGVVLLVGSTYLSTRLAVRLFGNGAKPPAT